jgi:hypothetical protein
MNKIFKLMTAVILVTSIGMTSGCKKTFDNPPGAADPDIVANKSIKDLKALHTSSGAYDIITSDIIISGVVVADDKSGNLYKQLFIQDATGGIQILLDANSLYGAYPVGRRIFIKCKDLCISDYNGLIALGVKATVGGLPSQEGIPGNLISRYVIGGSTNNPVVPTVVTLAQLGTNMQDKYLGTLIQLNGWEFADTTLTHSDTSAYKSTQNLDIKNCATEQVIIRTSAYANFAAKQVPGGNGNVVAVYTVFGTTKQLIIRDENDVQLNSPRCNLFEEFFYRLRPQDNNLDVNIPGWRNVAPVSAANWKNSLFGSSFTGRVAKVSAFGTGLSADTAWLITPPIVIPAGATSKFSFKTAYQFAVGPTKLHAFISTNYTGGDPNAATWVQLTNDAQIPGNTNTSNSSSFSSLQTTGDISLAPYIGQTVRIAFKYVGSTTSSPARTTNFEIDDIQITR